MLDESSSDYNVEEELGSLVAREVTSGLPSRGWFRAIVLDLRWCRGHRVEVGPELMGACSEVEWQRHTIDG